MKEKEKKALVILCWGLWLLLGTLLSVSSVQAEKGPSPPQAPKEASGSEIPHKSVKEKTLKWKDDGQKKSCEAKAGIIRGHFLKAREFSIQGDSCSSEKEARSFGEKLEELKKDCPSGFAEQAGFTPKVVKNVRTLQSLGKERCPESQTTHAPKGSP